jgi:uncharacterized Zn-finger protein
MSTPNVNDYERLGTERDVVIQRSELPLHCPRDNSAIWCAHPRVFLPIEQSTQQSVRCPYCGTLYRLVD